MDKLSHDEVITLVRELNSRVSTLESRIDLISTRRRRSIDHREAVISLLPVAFASFGPRKFTVRDLDEHANEMRDAPLREVLDAIGSTRQIGTALVNNADAMTPTLRLVYVGDSSEGKIWVIKPR